MEKGKLAIAFIFLALFCGSVAWSEYDLVTRSGIIFSVASVSGLIMLLITLLRAPEGYEDETGFHIGALADSALL
jgi:hypothetical protein